MTSLKNLKTCAVRYHMFFIEKELSRLTAAMQAAALHGDKLQFKKNHFRDLLYSGLERSTLKAMGAFFSSLEIAHKVSKAINITCRAPVVLDPACGAGDLLLAYISRIGVSSSLRSTLAILSKTIIAYDIEPLFVECAKLRIIAHAMQLGSVWDLVSLEEAKGLLGSVRCGDGLADNVWENGYDVVLMNPPFFTLPKYQGMQWGAKRITAAAAFLEKAVACAPDNAQIISILPDVVRSGSRYESLRRVVNKAAAQINTQHYGKFDHMADVDVFILDVTKGTRRSSVDHNWGKQKPDGRHLGESFSVKVGPVVPHRDPEEGELLPFLSAKTCPPWHEIDTPPTRRRFSGTKYKGPFVVIRRTSSPSDKHRCVPTIIAGTGEYAVENHLIIVQPTDNGLDTCRQLVKVLSKDATQNWINQRIRCRHLTVSAVKELPLGQEVTDGV